MGVELVEGRDLFCRDNVVYMRTTEGERQVDVIYRRIDDTYLDPMQFRPDSVLGVAGLLNAARAGNVVISSAVGNGVGDDKLVYTYVPTIIEYYLGEKPLLANVDTFRCWLDEEREEVLDRIDELVIKPVEGSGGYGIVFGPDASEKELEAIGKKIRSDPRGWIAQPVVQLSTVPTQIDDKLAPRHVDLRPFAVNDGDDVGTAGWADARRAARGLAGGQLQPGRRLQGHLGAGVPRVGGRPRTRRRRGGAVAAQDAQAPKAENGSDGSSHSSSNSNRRCAAEERLAAESAAQQQQAVRTDVRPQRRIAVLDRPLRGACRRHRPHSRRDGAPAARGFQRRPGPGVADAAEGAGHRTARRPLDVWSLTDIVAFSRDTEGALLDRRLDLGRAGKCPWRTGSHLHRDLGVPQHHLQRARRTGTRRQTAWPARVLSFVEGRAAMFAGLADSTLSRDDGYRFMVLGRAIERVDMTVRLLLSRVGDSASSPAWVTLLRSAGAHDTYLRTYRGALDAGRVVEFMLLDRLFPRSIFYSLRLAEHSLDELINRPHNRLGATAEAQRLLGRARSELEFLRPGVLLESLEKRLAGLQKTCRDVGEALAVQYFHSAPWVAWHDAGHNGSLVIEEGEV